MRNRRFARWAALAAMFLRTAIPAAALPREDSMRATFRGNVHPAIAEARDAGPADPSTPMGRMILLLGRRPGAQAELDALLEAQHDPASALYHRWLTPEEFGARFGPSDEDLLRIESWLQQNGFTIDEVARGRGWINFSGTAGQVESAFAAPIHEFAIAGELRHANLADPSVPASLAPMISGIASLHDFPKRSYRVAAPEEERRRGPAPGYTDTFGAHCLGPADFARIYGLESLYASGIDGSGQKIAIVGRVRIDPADVREFRSRFGLPARDPQIVVNGPDPGFWDTGEEEEADLDVEWSGGVAPGATVILVISQSTTASDGIDLSAQYAVDQNLAPVVSTSFGDCEADMGASNLLFYDRLWEQASAQGMTSFVSSGDTGFAGCNGGDDLKPSGTGVNGVASSVHDVAVGGTKFDDSGQSSLYWAGKPDAVTGLSAISYIPEKGWNESGTVPGGHGLWASGGGASGVHAKPDWQSSPGVPADGKRDLPDVSFSAATHDGYFIYQSDNGGAATIGGTSASSPAWAGIMALLVQKTGERQGNANRAFYPIATAQAAGSPAVFHDIASGNSDVPGLAGAACATGYDLVTGLGSVDAAALAAAWTSLPAEVFPPAPPRKIAPITPPSPSPVDRSGP